MPRRHALLFLASALSPLACAPSSPDGPQATQVDAAPALPTALQAALAQLRAPELLDRLAGLDQLAQLSPEQPEALQALIALLHDPEISLAVAAAQRLAALHAVPTPAPIVAGLHTALKAEAPILRATALTTLQRLERSQPGLVSGALDWPALLRGLLNDPSPPVRTAALDAWGLSLAHRAPPAHLLERALGDDSAMVRAAAARLSARLSPAPPSLLEPLLARVQDADAQVRLWTRAAISQLDPFNPQGLEIWAGLLKRGGADTFFIQAFLAIGQAGPEAALKSLFGDDPDHWVEVVAQLMNTARPQLEDNLRWLALHAAHQAQGDLRPLLGALLRAAKDPQGELRREALRALARLAPQLPEALQPLQRGLEDPEALVRQAALLALRPLIETQPQLLKVLEQTLRDPDEAVRVLATESFAQFARLPGLSASLVPLLREQGTDHAEAVRSAALEGLTALLDLEVLPEGLSEELLKTLKNTQESGRVGILRGLLRVTQSERLAPFLQTVRELVADQSPKVRLAAVQALGYLGTLGLRAQELVSVLVDRLGDTAPEVQEAALRALGSLKEQAASALPQLVPLLLKGSDQVKEAALYAIGQMGQAADYAQPALKLLARGKGRLAQLAQELLDKLIH